MNGMQYCIDKVIWCSLVDTTILDSQAIIVCTEVFLYGVLAFNFVLAFKYACCRMRVSFDNKSSDFKSKQWEKTSTCPCLKDKVRI